jgi:hypothetical protein
LLFPSINTTVVMVKSMGEGLIGKNVRLGFGMRNVAFDPARMVSQKICIQNRTPFRSGYDEDPSRRGKDKKVEATFWSHECVKRRLGD